MSGTDDNDKREPCEECGAMLLPECLKDGLCPVCDLNYEVGQLEDRDRGDS